MIVAEHHVAVGNVPRDGDGVAAPRQYPVEFAKRLGSPLPDPMKSGRLLSGIEERSGFQFRAAREAHKAEDPEGYLSTSEQVAFPLELMNRGAVPHVVLAHNLKTTFKRRLHQRIRWLSWFEGIIVLSAELERFLVEDIELDSTRVHLINQGADSQFFRPRPETPSEAGLIVAVGREHRDYQTLIRAMHRLPDARLIVVANSPWAKGDGIQSKGEATEPIPSNVEFVGWLSDKELQRLYARASAAVVPLLDGTTFAAGVNSVIEAQAMGLPTIVTFTPGLQSYYDDSTAAVVPAGDPVAMSSQIERALSDRSWAESIGNAARTLTETGRNMDTFVEQVAAVVERAAKCRR